MAVNFFGDTVKISVDPSFRAPVITSLNDSTIRSFYTTIDCANYKALVTTLISYKEQNQLDDWLYYQLIRNTAEQLSPKSKNYQQYTLYKWFLLVKSGYATHLRVKGEKLLFYVKSNEEIFNIPCITLNGEQYVCLNYHDYKAIDFEKEQFTSINISIPEAQKRFSYKIKKLPDFKTENYGVKDLQFVYYQTEYHFKVMLNKQLKKIFNNYPIVDYETYFNIPLSKPTYSSLIPLLKENIKKMSEKDGVDYLMRFTRYAFAFESDTKNFGAEKRLSPEQTLFYESSDCEDRAALFFYLVKELYNLPMIVLSYPKHVSVAVQFNQPLKNAISFKGNNYSICDPTPQSEDLRIGQSLHALKKVPYDIVYAYNPVK